MGALPPPLRNCLAPGANLSARWGGWRAFVHLRGGRGWIGTEGNSSLGIWNEVEPPRRKLIDTIFVDRRYCTDDCDVRVHDCFVPAGGLGWRGPIPGFHKPAKRNGTVNKMMQLKKYRLWYNCNPWMIFFADCVKVRCQLNRGKKIGENR